MIPLLPYYSFRSRQHADNWQLQTKFRHTALPSQAFRYEPVARHGRDKTHAIIHFGIMYIHHKHTCEVRTIYQAKHFVLVTLNLYK